MRKGEAIKIRVPVAIKHALKRLADARLTSESEIAREALIAYLDTRGITVQNLREESPPYKISSKRRAEIDQDVIEIVKQGVESRRQKPSPPK